MEDIYSPEERFAAIDENIARIRENTERAAAKAGRKAEEVRLMAVTKTVAPVFINRALANGIDLIGENKVQELESKIDFLEPKTVEKHIIGHLQTNKVAKILPHISAVQSVDSIKLAEKISACSKNIGKITDILVEINIASEESKTGFLPQEAEEALIQISELDGIRLRGIMSVPPVCDTETEIRKYFHEVYKIFVDNKNKISNNIMDTLSLGMSSDYEAAIGEGSTLIRVGSAMFGMRRY